MLTTRFVLHVFAAHANVTATVFLIPFYIEQMREERKQIHPKCATYLNSTFIAALQTLIKCPAAHDENYWRRMQNGTEAAEKYILMKFSEISARPPFPVAPNFLFCVALQPSWVIPLFGDLAIICRESLSRLGYSPIWDVINTSNIAPFAWNY